ncbi:MULTISPECIES: hypothetical protein [Sphingobacterium]|uniref:Uncharacterized protein n=1 Tax=Sphingobacterium populi TaxID=1812824 RepID=A0ABW5U7X4_9SPHI|nr:hypothetical protein [Sphingobacterium sp. CFCC 11742]
MKKQINIDVASFYQSDYQHLSWSIEDGQESGKSVLEGSQSGATSISDALAKHLQQIGQSLRESDSLSDYDMSLSFDEGMEDQQKDEFTAAFNDSNTRDESF